MQKSTKILISFLICTGLIFTYSLYKGKQEAKERKEDYLAYQEAVKCINEVRDINEAMTTIYKTTEKYKETKGTLINKARGHSILDEYSQVEIIIENLFEVDPNLESDNELNLIYAKSAYEKRNITNSKEAINRINKSELNKEQKIKLDELIKQIG
ncbi:MAG: hypothetical protein RR657_06245 [Peptostreptococcaceae bacterium]